MQSRKSWIATRAMVDIVSAACPEGNDFQDDAEIKSIRTIRKTGQLVYKLLEEVLEDALTDENKRNA
jgi:hypothetical protein